MKKDVLNRKDKIDLIINIINNYSITNSFASFSLDGDQGVGKTYIINELNNELKSIKVNDEYKYFVIDYNCWEYDYYGEPLNSILININNTIEESNDRFNEKFKQVLIEVSKDLSTLVIDRAVSRNQFLNTLVNYVKQLFNRIKKQYESNNYIDDNYNLKKVLKRIRNSVGKISSEKTIVIIIDELDRCLPEYQIKVLERLHHVFNDMDNVIIITVFDKALIKNTITSIFGSNISVERYLDKFISFSLNIDIGEYQPSIIDDNPDLFNDSKFSEKDNTFINNLIKKSNANIRTIERLFSNLKLINSVLNVDFSHKNYVSILEFEIVIILLRLTIKELKNTDNLLIANESDIIKRAVNTSFSNNTTMGGLRYNKEYFSVLYDAFIQLQEVVNENKVVNILYDYDNNSILICKVLLSLLYKCDLYSWAIWLEQDTLDICKNALKYIDMFYTK